LNAANVAPTANDATLNAEIISFIDINIDSYISDDTDSDSALTVEIVS